MAMAAKTVAAPRARSGAFDAGREEGGLRTGKRFAVGRTGFYTVGCEKSSKMRVSAAAVLPTVRATPGSTANRVLVRHGLRGTAEAS
jgi:hypothetical protein